MTHIRTNVGHGMLVLSVPNPDRTVRIYEFAYIPIATFARMWVIGFVDKKASL